MPETTSNFSREELRDIRDRAIGSIKHTLNPDLDWVQACVDLSKAADVLNRLAAKKEVSEYRQSLRFPYLNSLTDEVGLDTKLSPRTPPTPPPPENPTDLI